MKTKRFPISTSKSLDGFKANDHWLAEALGAKYTHRHGYTLASARRVRQFETLREAGFDASRRYFPSDKEPYTFHRQGRSLGGPHYTLSEALKLAGFTEPKLVAK